MTLRDEIREQPEVAARFLEAQAENIESIAASLRDRRRGMLSSRRAAALGAVRDAAETGPLQDCPDRGDPEATGWQTVRLAGRARAQRVEVWSTACSDRS